MRRYFFDTEYIDGPTVELISIGLIDENDREFYAVSNEFNAKRANPWVRQNVLTKLPSSADWLPRVEIARRLTAYVEQGFGPIEFWGWFCAHDWTLLCSLFGGMLSVPQGWPHLSYDIRQFLSFSQRHIVLPARPEHAHDALVDARWTRDVYRTAKGQIRAFQTIEGDAATLTRWAHAQCRSGPLRIPGSSVPVGWVLAELASGKSLELLETEFQIPMSQLVAVLRDLARGVS